ncbi:MAG TPA: DNA polymerase I [Clostridiaceae bacterium]|nr:DNA polymerase I [Clostridiaceae bacterium]
MSKNFFEKNSRKHLMLIDGNSLINRAFYAGAGRRMLTAPDGTPSGAVFTFLNMFLSYAEQINPDSIIVAFDRKEKTFRHELYADYKGTRKPMPDDLAVQMPLLKEMLNALNVCCVEEKGYEADDLIGTYAKIAAEDNYNVYVVTGDKDSFQLIDDHVYIVLPVTRSGSTSDSLMDRDAFEAEYGFGPEKFVDFKAIMGDSSDNIPGIRGIGQVGASDLIRNHGTLKQIYDTLDHDKTKIPNKYHNKLYDDREMAFLSYDLALINKKVPIRISARDAVKEKPDIKKLTDFFQKMGFQTMFERFGIEQDNSIIDKTELAELKEYRTIQEFLNNAGFDSIVWLVLPNENSFLLSKNTGFIMLEPMQIQLICQDIFEIDNQIIVWDYKNWLKTINLGNLKNQPFDIQVAAYLLNQGKSEDFTSVFQNVFQQNFIQLNKKPSLNEQIEYAKQMALAMLKLQEIQRDLIRKQNMELLAYTIEMPLTPILADMEKRGVSADKTQLDSLNKIMLKEINELEEQIYKYSFEKFNINSSQQLSDVLFNQLKLPSGKKLASGYYSTAAGELERLREMHPIVDLIIEYREVSKLNSTFVDGLRKSINPLDGRIHTTYHQTLTTTGRLSSSDPNLQNIPIRSERSKAIREVFIAAPGCKLLGADYSQIELRLLAHLSEDPDLIQAFNDGIDIHSNTAMRIFDKKINEITSRERALAKTVNFSIIYGVTPFGLSQDLKSSVDTATEYINSYYEHYAKVKPYLESLIEKAKQDGYVETMFGRRRYIPELNSSQFHTRNFGERAAMNAPLQGSAADLIKLAMNRIDRVLQQQNLQARLILQVHDELIIELPEQEVEQVSQILKDGMENVVKLKVPLLAEVSVGDSWAEI